MVRHSVFADKARTVEAEYDRKPLDGHVVNHVVVGPLHERRVDIAERYQAAGRQSCRESDRMAFGDADVEASVGHLPLQDIHGAAREHGRCDAYDAFVEAGELEERITEYVLVAVGLVVARIDEQFAGDGIEPAGGMPYRRVAFGRFVTLALFGNDVEQFRARNAPHVAQYPYQRLQVVAVHGAEIAGS